MSPPSTQLLAVSADCDLQVTVYMDMILKNAVRGSLPTCWWEMSLCSRPSL